MAIWGGEHYLSRDGMVGAMPVDPAHWDLLDKATLGNGYIEEWDIIEYDFENNWLQYRADKLGNEVKFSKVTKDQYFPTLLVNAITLFQWGNVQCYDNKVSEGYIDNRNTLGEVYSNTLSTQSTIYGNTLAITSRINANVLNNASSIHDNMLDVNSLISVNTLDGDASIFGNTLGDHGVIVENNIEVAGRIYNNTIGDYSEIRGNRINTSAALAAKILNTNVHFRYNIIGLIINDGETYTSNIENKRAESGFSNFEVTIDITPMSGGILNIPSANNYCGIIKLTGTSQTFNKIDGIVFGNFSFTLYPASGTIVTLTGTPIGTPPSTGKIVLSTSNIVVDGSKEDFVTLELSKANPSTQYLLQTNAQHYI